MLFGGQPASAGGACGPGRQAAPWPFRRPPDQDGQTVKGVLAVLLPAAESLGIDDQHPIAGDPPAGDSLQPTPGFVGQGAGPGNVKAKLNGSGNLVDMLSARPGGSNETLPDFVFVDGDGRCDVDFHLETISILEPVKRTHSPWGLPNGSTFPAGSAVRQCFAGGGVRFRFTVSIHLSATCWQAKPGRSCCNPSGGRTRTRCLATV